MNRNTDTEAFFEFLRFASVSADPSYQPHLESCVFWLEHWLRDAGLEVTVFQTPGKPVILANTKQRPGLKTVLIYGHYDVQPVDPLNLWRKPPFEPHLEGDLVIARGSADNKGQIFAHLLGVRDALREGNLSSNVLFLIEGEEEIGSPNLAPFIRTHASDIKCDVAVISDSYMAAPGVPTFTYGLRGLGSMELHVTGPAQDLHSGFFGGAVANPLTALARLLATLHHSDGKVAVQGFYDAVLPVEAWEREAWAKTPYTDQRLISISGAPELAGEVGFSPVERIWARPTAEINGMWGGYQGPGNKTVLPKEAHAKLTFRLVPNQDPVHILHLVEEHFNQQPHPGVRLEIVNGAKKGDVGRPYLCNPQKGYGLAARKALADVFGHAEPALIREGGTIPVVAEFKTILGTDTLLLGLALPDCNAHSPNESFPLSHLDLGKKLNRALLTRIASETP